MTKYYWCDKKKQEKKEEEPTKPPVIFVTSDSGGSNSDNCVDIMDNTIMFYGVVDEYNAKSLNKALRLLDRDLQVFKVKYDSEPPPINLHINSYGGSVFAAFSIVDTIKASRTPVYTHVDGSAASAATLISCVGEKRYITENSYMLIHQLSSSVWGKFEEVKDEMENLETLMANIKKIYKLHTSIPVKELNEILKHDLWLDAKKCLKWGLVDEIK